MGYVFDVRLNPIREGVFFSLFFLTGGMEELRLDITLNGKQVNVGECTTLAEFVASRGFKQNNIIIEYNYVIVKAENWNGIVLKQHDCLEIVTFVGGG